MGGKAPEKVDHCHDLEKKKSVTLTVFHQEKSKKGESMTRRKNQMHLQETIVGFLVQAELVEGAIVRVAVLLAGLDRHLVVMELWSILISWPPYSQLVWLTTALKTRHLSLLLSVWLLVVLDWDISLQTLPFLFPLLCNLIQKLLETPLLLKISLRNKCTINQSSLRSKNSNFLMILQRILL